MSNEENIELNKRKSRELARKKRRSAYRSKMRFCCTAFTLGLIYCLIHIGYGAVINVVKIIAYQGKEITLKEQLKKSQDINEDLKQQKKVITSDNSIEGIARNNLKMAAPDEVLIIVNQKVEEPKPQNKTISLNKLFKKEEKENDQTGSIYIPPEVVEE